MSEQRPLTILCIASYEKGQAFMREVKRQGCRVFLLTADKLRDADWPRESLDDIFYMPDLYKRQDVIHGVSYLARSEIIDRIVPLDDYDLEVAAALREHLRVPGMGDTTTRYFRDKLAMRVRAQNHGILVPDFVHVLNYDRLRHYMDHVPAPWVLKPRSEASAVGIKKIHNAQELWDALDLLGDRQSYYVLERFVPGDVYHVDSIIFNREVLMAQAHQYSQPPMSVVYEGGLFRSETVQRGSADEEALRAMNEKLVSTLGLVRGITHTEFIKGRDDGRFYFLETAARVGGANISDLVEAETGISLWEEWAKIEIAGEDGQYQLPPIRQDYAGILISLARQEYPDTSAYNDPEVVWRLNKRHHAGLVVASSEQNRVHELLDQYTARFYNDFFATQPAPTKPTS
jgi:biotin carboxylase